MKLNQPTIADVLHLAADKYLWRGTERNWSTSNYKAIYSCVSVDAAIRHYQYVLKWNDRYANRFRRRINKGLQAMGLRTTSLTQYVDLEHEFRWSNRKIQAARYAWLKFAALIAEEQGV